MLEKKQIKVGVSVLSLKPWSIVRGGSNESLKILSDEKTGLDGLQLHLLDSWRDKDLKELPENSVLSFQNDKRHAKGETSHFIKDRLNLFKRLFPKAIPIDSEEFFEEKVLEISPLRKDFLPKDYLTRKGFKVVFNTEHVSKMSQLKDFHEQCLFTEELVKNEKIELIIFQTRDREEFDSFINGGFYSLRILMSIVMRSKKNVIIKVPSLWLVGNYYLLREVKNAILKCAID